MESPVKAPFSGGWGDWRAWLGLALAVVIIVLVVKKSPLPAAVKP